MANRFFSLLRYCAIPLLSLVVIGCPAPEDETDKGFHGLVYYSLNGNIRRINLSSGTIVTIAKGIAPTVTPSGKIVAVIDGVGLVEYENDGSHKRTIVTQDIAQSREPHDDVFIDPQVSSNGQYIAYEGVRGSIFIVDANGSFVHAIGDHMHPLKRPQWLPNGEMIAQGNDGLYKITTQFEVAGRIGDQSEIGQHSISPDGKKIAALIGGEVWIMNVDGTQSTRMMSGSNVHYPTWSSSGKHIMVKDGCDMKLFPVDGGMVASFRGRYFSYKDDECPSEYQIDWQ